MSHGSYSIFISSKAPPVLRSPSAVVSAKVFRLNFGICFRETASKPRQRFQRALFSANIVISVCFVMEAIW